jgi:sugar fermentation stimulation protein A
VRFEGSLVEGRFLSRDNRFRVTVEVDGQPVWAHLPNSGRLGELLVPGHRVLLAERPAPHRKTRYDFCLVEADARSESADGRWASVDARWVSVDARLPNDLVAEALRLGRLAPLAGYPTVKREVAFGQSRIDFLLEAPDRAPCLLEIKSVTLVIEGLGCFPDAVTARGKRHLLELAEAQEAGYRAAALFVVQRDDTAGLRPHDESDPDFGRTLREVARRGVEVYAYGCRVEPACVEVTRRLPVHLE